MTLNLRAWDKETKVIREVVSINFSTKIITCEWKSNEVESCTEPYDKYLLEGQYELMQSTGLKDKENTEIFDGDIVIMDSLPKSFYSGYFEVVKARSGEWRLEKERGGVVLAYNPYNIKVVGNKFTHSHLLKGGLKDE